MKLISSRENALYKELKQLASTAQARRRAGQTLLDGVHLCQSWLDQVGQPIWCVVNEAAQTHGEIIPLVQRCEHLLILSDALYQSLSQVEHGVGIFFVIATPEPIPPVVVNRNAIVLENLQDPGNVGSLLRSAAAAGIDQVFCGPETVSLWSPKVLRAGMGAHFLIDIYEQIDLPQLLEQAAVPILATSSHATKTLYECDLNRPLIWLFGHEGRGLSEALQSRASERVSIPHLGNMESLNVAACAAVCFFEQMRQTLLVK